jgi:uncharacterized membrane protein YfcA
VTIALVGALAALVGGFIKGAISFGFPTISTPLLALFIDVKTAVAVLVPPNMVLDGIQARRGGGLAAMARRLFVLVVAGAVGIVVGTRLLVVLPAHVATGVLGGFVLLFVAANATRFQPRVPAHWEPWLAVPVGLVAGVVGGITNVPGTPLVIYFYALGMAKQEFVRAVSVSFFLYKVVQLAALIWYGAFTLDLVVPTLGITAVAVGAFVLGVKLQDRMEQRVFNRVVLVYLGALGLWLVVRAIAR